MPATNKLVFNPFTGNFDTIAVQPGVPVYLQDEFPYTTEPESDDAYVWWQSRVDGTDGNYTLWLKEPTSASGLQFEFDFVDMQSLSSYGGGRTLTFTRSGSVGSYFNSAGVLVQGVAANTPRFDYNPNTLVCRGLLMEGTRTNLLKQSEDITTTWTVTNATRTANVTASPDGTSTADSLVEDATASVGHFIGQTISFTSGQIYAVSYFAKEIAGNANKRYLGINLGLAAFGTNQNAVFDLAAGTVTGGSATGFIEQCPNGWWRCTVVATATISTTAQVQIRLSNSSTSAVPSYTGDGSSGIYLWGAQCEAAPNVSSYIKTTTATVTRNADVLSMDVTSILSATAGTCYVEGMLHDAALTGAVRGLWQIDGGADTDRHVVQVDSTEAFLRARSKVASTDQDNLNSASFSSLTAFRHAYAFTANDFSSSFNGGAVVIDSSGSLPASQTTLRLASSAVAGGNEMFGWLRRFKYFNQRRTNAQLIVMTT